MEYIIREKPVALLVKEMHPNYLTESSDPISSCTILYIDDNPMDTWLAEKIFLSMGVANRVTTASNGLKGLKVLHDYFHRYKKLPELIIADLQMPMMDGFELIESIKSLPYYQEKQTLLILITEDLDVEDIQRTNDLNIKNILFKPLDKGELLKLFDSLLNR